MTIKCKLKLIIKPGKATPTPPIAPILGQYGLNLMNFCNKFNLLTKNINLDFIHIKIIIFQDLSYEILIGTESLSNYLKKILKLEKFSNKPGKEKISHFNFDLLNKISNDRNIFEKKNFFSIKKIILGTLISIGLI